MPQKNLKVQRVLETLTIFRRSLIYQTKEFFQNSTLHGVRYIAETGRPIGEKFMWFCFTSIGAVTALVIIMSLWEKFQTNPTITGLDTDFHNQNVIFPTVVVCPEAPFDHNKAYDAAFRVLSNYDNDTANLATPFMEALTSLSFENLKDAEVMAEAIPKEMLEKKTIRELVFQARISCEETLIECKYRDETLKCCQSFETVYTEHGICFAFNSIFKSTEDSDISTGPPRDLYETDKKWALFFVPNITSRIFIFSNEEYFGNDFNAQVEWGEGEILEVRISKRNTYTTDDARQLTIGQRKCIFYNEVKLQYFPNDYTFSSCMKECRINKAIKLCKCNPPFYKPISNAPMCNLSHFACLNRYKTNITSIKDCVFCELSCSKTVFNIEKLIKNLDHPETPGVLVEFLTWPIIRYKREVLFGWVDLLVSFGGIASLFLGFSLLSGVEIIYYFTLRACCMVYRNREELSEIEERIKLQPPPAIDLSLKFKYRAPNTNLKTESDDDSTTRNNLNRPHRNDKPINLDKHNNLQLAYPKMTTDGNEKGKRRHFEKDFNGYSKSLFKSTKVKPHKLESVDTWQYGQYLP